MLSYLAKLYLAALALSRPLVDFAFLRCNLALSWPSALHCSGPVQAVLLRCIALAPSRPLLNFLEKIGHCSRNSISWCTP